MLLAALQANAWTELNHDWTIPSPAGRIGIQEIERSGTALPHGTFTLLRLGPREHYLPCSFFTAVGIFTFSLTTALSCLVFLVLRRTKQTK